MVRFAGLKLSLYFKRKQRKKQRNQREQFLLFAKQKRKNFNQKSGFAHDIHIS